MSELRESQIQLDRDHVEAHSVILMIDDPTIPENHATPHCNALCLQYEALFFHRDFATWNSQHSAIVRMMRTVIAAQNGRSMTAGFPWGSMMCLAFNTEAAEQIAKNFPILFARPIPDATLTTLIDEFERLKPRNGDDARQKMFEAAIRKHCLS
jgi:hypothetical protein